MFSTRGEKERLLKNGLAATSKRFQPGVESLEGRTLPSAAHLSIGMPVLDMVVQTSYGVSLNIRIDFKSFDIGSGGSAALESSLRDAGVSNVQAASAGQAAPVTTPSAVNASSVLDLEAAAAPSLAKLIAVPVSATSSGDGSFFTSLANVPVAARPVVRTALVETRFLAGFNAFIDQPLVSPTVPTASTSVVLLDRLVQPPAQPVQAISNRFEFMGGGGGSMLEYILPDDQEATPAPSRAQPVDPPSTEQEEMAPQDLGAAAASRVEAVWLAPEDLAPPIHEPVEQVQLTPELVSEVAALSACLVGLPLNYSKDAAELREDEEKRRVSM